MTVYARMKCTQTVLFENSVSSVIMTPISASDGSGNESYSKYTPSGELKLMITNPDASGQFIPGKIYDVVISQTE